MGSMRDHRHCGSGTKEKGRYGSNRHIAKFFPSQSYDYIFL